MKSGFVALIGRPNVINIDEYADRTKDSYNIK